MKEMTEDEIIRERLLTKTSVLGKAPIKKCADSLLNYIESIRHTQDEESQNAADTLLWELHMLEKEAAKSELIGHTCAEELKEYGLLQEQIDASIDQASKDIEQDKARLHQEMTLRQYKEEYESLAKLVNNLPCRQELETKLDKENQLLTKSKDELDQITLRMETRSKQFELLLRTIHDLRQTLDEEQKLEQQTQLLRQQTTPTTTQDDEEDEDDDDDDDDDEEGEIDASSSMEVITSPCSSPQPGTLSATST